MMAQGNNKPGLGFVVKWIVAFMVAGAVSTLLTFAILFVAQHTAIPGWSGILLIALVTGAVLGAGQGFIMLPYLDRSEVWIAVTALGYTAGLAIPSLLDFDPLLRYALVGVALGLLQWWVLRRYVQSAGWWIGINIVCWLVAGTVDHGAILYSPVTGFTMLWLLTHPRQQTQLATSVVNTLWFESEGEKRDGDYYKEICSDKDNG